LASSIRRHRAAGWIALVASLFIATAAGAQNTAAPQASVSGQVVTPGVTRQIPIPGVMVTVHRVGQDSAGALDSARTNAQGRYTVHYNRFGDDAVYFAAAIYSGIAYFSAPLQSARATGEQGEITVFDTTSRAVEMHVRGHHLVVSGPRPDGKRDIVEVWEISNDTTVTVVGRDSLAPVWTGSLPRGATNVSGGQGDVSPGAIVARGDRVALLAPFGPGVKQISYSYTLPGSSFPLVITLERATGVLEVLLEEPAAQVTGAALRAMDAATTGGRTFKRFLAQDVGAGDSFRVIVPTTTATTRTWVLAILSGTIALIMVGALVRALGRRGGRTRPRASRAAPYTEELLDSIVRLDARHESGDPTLDETSYVEARASLKTQLADALAARTRAT
jgi:hypothetical protein